LANKTSKTVIFTDLDGSFLDQQYNYNTIKPIINHLQTLNTPIVFCSSKTKAEILFYQKTLKINEPFIAENGAAIYIPKNYFTTYPKSNKQTDQHEVIELGAPYKAIRNKMKRIAQKLKMKIIGFGDMTEQEVAQQAGLTLQMAKLAKQRQYDEPFRIVQGNPERFLKTLKEQGLTCTQGGRYYHLMGNNDKGKATALLRNLYDVEFGRVATIGVGDSRNDQPMLKQVDIPIFVQKRKENALRDTWKKIANLAG
jgi:mannosyl-3-phosphoglycerate phosphatase